MAVMLVELIAVSAHEAARTWDCSTPNCPNTATKKGPGGKPYCDGCRTRIYAKKVATTTRRHGTSSGGLTKLLVDADRAMLTIDELTRRMRAEAKACERASRSPRAPDLMRTLKHEVVLTMQALAQRLSELPVI